MATAMINLVLMGSTIPYIVSKQGKALVAVQLNPI